LRETMSFDVLSVNIGATALGVASYQNIQEPKK